MQVFHGKINNHSADLFSRFLKGENLEPLIIDRVVSDLKGKLGLSYDRVVSSVKQIINSSKKENIYHTFVFTTKDKDHKLTSLEKAVFVRLVNLAHKDLGAFILINDEIVYYPEFYDTQEDAVIEKYVLRMLKDLTLKQKEIAFRSKIKKLFSWNLSTTRVKELA